MTSFDSDVRVQKKNLIPIRIDSFVKSIAGIDTCVRQQKFRIN